MTSQKTIDQLKRDWKAAEHFANCLQNHDTRKSAAQDEANAKFMLYKDAKRSQK